MQQYADLELSLHKFDEGRYSVQFRFSQPGSEADAGLGQDKLVLLELNPGDEAFAAPVSDPDAYATALTDALFKDPALRVAFAQARASAQSQNIPLQLRLWISASAPELQRLRWELLRDPQDQSPLSTNENIYFSRYFSSPDWHPVHLQPKGSLRALAAVASPLDLADYKLAPIDAAGELERARSGLVDVALTSLPAEGKPASADEIIRALRAEGSDILYLVCHGVMANGRAILYLEGADGRHEAVSAEDFALSIKQLQKPPRLAVLVSCESAGNGTAETLSALGPRLVEAGIPAVIAMQANLRMDTAAQFMPVFFSELQKDGQIDRALVVARSMVRKQPDFWVPVLFMRLKSGRLWYTPGTNVDGKAYDQWPALVDVIQNGLCTPVLGPGLVEPLLGSTGDIARYWAEKFKYPMSPHERESLPQVAQFVSVNQPSQGFVFNRLKEYLRETLRETYKDTLPAAMLKGETPLDDLVNAIGAQKRQKNPLDAHCVLAQLPLSVYITANADELLEEALRETGRKPQSVICPWNEEIDQAPILPVDRDHPLVYHFFGRWNQPESLVLTEDDYFRFLIGVTSNKDIIPLAVGKALTKAGMLFMGFQPDEWAFRALFHTILAQPGSQLRYKYAQVAAQVEPEDERLLAPQRARKYLEKYLHDAHDEKIEIYWGSSQEFAAALWQAWQAGGN